MRVFFCQAETFHAILRTCLAPSAYPIWMLSIRQR